MFHRPLLKNSPALKGEITTKFPSEKNVLLFSFKYSSLLAEFLQVWSEKKKKKNILKL